LYLSVTATLANGLTHRPNGGAEEGKEFDPLQQQLQQQATPTHQSVQDDQVSVSSQVFVTLVF
jgi:hypothetical protein